MNINDRIKNISEYFVSMNVAAENGIIYVLVNFPQRWACSELTEYNFNVTAVRAETPTSFYFFTSMENGFDKVFDAIEYNINFNKEAQIKVSLLKEKIDELKDIFENEDIETLKTLEFKYKKKKIKNTKKKELKSKIEENVIEDGIVEENIDYMEYPIQKTDNNNV